MTQREKLIEIYKAWQKEMNCDSCMGNDCDFCIREGRYVLVDKLLANGVVVLPCKVGDKIYIFSRGKVKECEINYIGISVKEEYCSLSFVEHYWDGSFMKSVSVSFDEIGKTVFLTREEAEEKIRSME